MIVIIDYGVGNLTSVLNMHKRLGIDAVISGDKEVISKADRLLLPGVGHFDKCMQNFNNSGLRSLVEDKVLNQHIPILGICAGAQMMTNASEEGVEQGLGWVDAQTILFKKESDPDFKIPHMGWTDLKIKKPSVLWKDLPDEPRFYFAHSFHFLLNDAADEIGSCHYGFDYTCAFHRNNVYGVQFHPEKSHKYGMKILMNFSSISA